MSKLRHGASAAAEIMLRLCIVPALRARMLAVLGATIGRNVRISECRFINLSNGFRNLHVGDDVHIGAGCMIDLEGVVRIGGGTTISPRVTLISHSDPGSAHGSPHARVYPPEARGIVIGQSCWIGAGTTMLSGVEIGDRVIVGAMALVRGVLEPGGMYVGIPARRMTDARTS